jgi:hypothetical protein
LQDFHPIDFGSKNNTHNVTIVEQKVLPVRLTNWNQLPRIEELHNTQCDFISIAVVQIPHEPQHADFAEAAVELVAGSGLLIFRVWGCTTEAYVKQNLQYRCVPVESAEKQILPQLWSQFLQVFALCLWLLKRRPAPH